MPWLALLRRERSFRLVVFLLMGPSGEVDERSGLARSATGRAHAGAVGCPAPAEWIGRNAVAVRGNSRQTPPDGRRRRRRRRHRGRGLPAAETYSGAGRPHDDESAGHDDEAAGHDDDHAAAAMPIWHLRSRATRRAPRRRLTGTRQSSTRRPRCLVRTGFAHGLTSFGSRRRCCTAGVLVLPDGEVHALAQTETWGFTDSGFRTSWTEPTPLPTSGADVRVAARHRC